MKFWPFKFIFYLMMNKEIILNSVNNHGPTSNLKSIRLSKPFIMDFLGKSKIKGCLRNLFHVLLKSPII